MKRKRENVARNQTMDTIFVASIISTIYFRFFSYSQYIFATNKHILGAVLKASLSRIYLWAL